MQNYLWQIIKFERYKSIYIANSINIAEKNSYINFEKLKLSLNS